MPRIYLHFPSVMWLKQSSPSGFLYLLSLFSSAQIKHVLSFPGTVEPYSELDCEVVWHPSFSAPPEGDFDLWVYEGTAQHLHCVAKVRQDNQKIIFVWTAALLFVALKNNSLTFCFLNTVGWMDYLTIRFIPLLSTFYFSTEDSKPPSTFKLTSANENSLLTSFASIVLFMNTLFIQYYLSLHTPTF